jgi:hypothetical protein
MAVVQGYPDGTFRPDDPVNRAEFTKIVISANFTSPAYRLCDPYSMYTYGDVGKDTWYAPYLCLASQHKIVQGYSDGTFRPDRTINFAEAAKIVALLSSYQNGVGYLDPTFPKNTGGPWYEVYVQRLRNKNAIPPTITHNDQLVTRGEMVFMMHQLKNVFENTDTWNTHSDAEHRFTMDFPPDWGKLNPRTQQYEEFNIIEPDVQTYGSSDGSLKVFVGYLTNADRQPGENWGTAVNRHLSLWHYTIMKADYRTYVQYNLSPENGNGIFYEVVANGDTAVIVGYDIPSTLSTAIKGSIRFTK